MASVLSSTEPPHDSPKTPLIAGVICGVCIGIAWTISFSNWLLKRYRRYRLRKKKRQREASGTSTVYRRPNQRRTGTYDMSTFDTNNTRNRASASDRTSTTSERIDRLVREISKDTGNVHADGDNAPDAEGAPSEDAGDSPLSHQLSSTSHSRNVPSWISESAWNRHRRGEAQDKASPTFPTNGASEYGSKSEAGSLSPVSAVLAEPDPRVRRVIDELEDIDVEERVKVSRSLRLLKR